ncbi:4-galactosyl-N-acetylglucosaminide 3-alpha-L-fucosyltransferase 9-like [Silurus meridionalis]|uniref:4-galactosyl-N-acetylglucosaminide 3-alpha-L-fucosyltransferase 9-like n=1 Tax=Silurus meridionalis TaxID=175797 RepID=UPI001EEB9CEF|nr:4-galactosyl-N-acetylglucosaminide 3-alpha-L-fucosyltransferase 9-like [Silurus meridionalis]XP_046714882.1 4-galactosyl-N-acetylglucosaminide 3-alpha-L-fucosyltransferase 9-like [Silurus meridionalis]
MLFKQSHGLVQNLVLPLIILVCFGGVFYTYYKPTISWLSCSNSPVPTPTDCLDKCFSLMKNFNQSMNTSTAVSNYTPAVKQQLPIATQTPKEESKENLEIISVLIWPWPFGYKFQAESCGVKFGIEGCRFTDDKNQHDKVHGIMFHHRDIGGDLQTITTMARPPHQRWVWMNMESPENSGRWGELENVFNITSNYRRDSDIWVPYGRLRKATEQEKNFQIPPKDKTVCWIVSHWNPNFRRVKYFDELTKHIKVEAYGRHFNRFVSDEDYKATMSSCKFYLSFENSIYKDYISEKLFNPLTLGAVPVVIGPPRDNYEEFIPADSFIHVDDFKTPQELAEYLTLLDQNQTLYEQYFNWRKEFIAESSYFGLEHACRICQYIRSYTGYRVFKNLNQWYFG